MKRKTILRILSYNLHKGKNLGNLNFILPDIKNALKICNCNLAFFQEVKGDQYEYLADEIWTHHAYGHNAIYQSGNHGNAIVSEYPFEHHINTDISTNRLERRGLLYGRVEVIGEKKTLHVLCTHLNLLEKARQLQLRKIAAFIKANIPDDEPLLFAGDFNDWRQRASDFLEKELGLRNVFDGDPFAEAHPPTFPSFFPVLRVDRLYYRNLRVLHAQVLRGRPWNRLSDHLPILCELEL